MDGIAREKYATVAIALRNQQMLTPLDHMADFELAWKSYQIADDRLEIRIRWQAGM